MFVFQLTKTFVFQYKNDKKLVKTVVDKPKSGSYYKVIMVTPCTPKSIEAQV